MPCTMNSVVVCSTHFRKMWICVWSLIHFLKKDKIYFNACWWFCWKTIEAISEIKRFAILNNDLRNVKNPSQNQSTIIICFCSANHATDKNHPTRQKNQITTLKGVAVARSWDGNLDIFFVHENQATINQSSSFEGKLDLAQSISFLLPWTEWKTIVTST